MKSFEEYFVMEEKLTTKDRDKLSDDDYGIIIKDKDGNVTERAYPLNDADHVVAAARMYPFAKRKYDREIVAELRRKIIAKAKEYNVPDSKIQSVIDDGPKTKTIKESFGPEDDDTSGTSEFDEYNVNEPDDCYVESKNDSIHMRPATKADVDRMYRWEMESIDKELQKDPKVQKLIREDVEQSIKDTQMIMDGRVTIGMFTACMIDDGEWRYIGEIYLIPSYRGRGIGSGILKKEIEQYPKIRLQVATSNDKAIKLYKSLGFKIVKENKKQKMYLMEYEADCISYAMGVDDSIYELSDDGFNIIADDGDYKVTFDPTKSDKWEEYIENHIKDTYWNEYINLKTHKIHFMINENGRIKHVINNGFEENPKLLETCNRLCEGHFKSIKELMLSNDFYKEHIKDWDSEEELKKSSTERFTSELKRELKNNPVQESWNTEESLKLFKELPKDLQEFLKKGDMSDIDEEYGIDGYWVEEFSSPEYLEIAGKSYPLKDDDPMYNAIDFAHDGGGNDFVYNPDDGYYYNLDHEAYDQFDHIHGDRLSSTKWSELIDPKRKSTKSKPNVEISLEFRNMTESHLYWDICHVVLDDEIDTKLCNKITDDYDVARKGTWRDEFFKRVDEFASKHNCQYIKTPVDEFKSFMKSDFRPTLFNWKFNIDGLKPRCMDIIKAFMKVIKELNIDTVQLNPPAYKLHKQIIEKYGNKIFQEGFFRKTKPQSKPTEDGVRINGQTIDEFEKAHGHNKSFDEIFKLYSDEKFINELKRFNETNKPGNKQHYSSAFKKVAQNIFTSADDDKYGATRNGFVDGLYPANKLRYITNNKSYGIEFSSSGYYENEVFMVSAKDGSVYYMKLNDPKYEVSKSFIDFLKSFDDKFFDEYLKNDFVQEGVIQNIKNKVSPFEKGLVYHISPEGTLDGQVFKPRVPEYLDKYDPSKPKFEDVETPRVCFSPSIEGCLNAILVNLGRWKTADKLRDWYVYIPEKPLKEYKHRTTKQLVDEKKVYDANLTKEIWIEEPVRLKQYGVIRIDSVTDKSKRKTVPTTNGETEKRNYYDFKWHWLIKPKVLKDVKYDYSPKEVCKDMVDTLSDYKYGIPENGRIVHGSEHDYDTKWKLQSPEEFEKNKGGICYDYVEFEEGYLQAYGIKCKKYYISTDLPGHDTHTFILVEDGKGGFIYPESSFKENEGTHEVKNLDHACAMVADGFWKINDNIKKVKEFKCYLWEYTGHPKYGSSIQKCMEYYSKGEPIKEWTQVEPDFGENKSNKAKALQEFVTHFRGGI